MARSRRQLRNLVLDRNYQLAFTLFLVVVCMAFMTGLGWLVLKEADIATQTAIQNVQTNVTMGAEFDATVAELVHRRELLTWILAGVGVAITLGLAAYGIKMTHRVAGPLHKIAYHCDRVVDGSFTELTALRKHDQLVDLHAAFKEAYNKLRERQFRELSVLRGVITAIEKAGLASRSPELARQLEALRERAKKKEVLFG